jgi:hypothetical protein
MENNKIIAIIVVIAVVLVAGYYCYTTFVAHPSYGEGTYVVGENISAGTYYRDGVAYSTGHMISAGDLLIIDDEPGNTVYVEQGNITFINESQTNEFQESWMGKESYF